MAHKHRQKLWTPMDSDTNFSDDYPWWTHFQPAFSTTYCIFVQQFSAHLFLVKQKWIMSLLFSKVHTDHSALLLNLPQVSCFSTTWSLLLLPVEKKLVRSEKLWIESVIRKTALTMSCCYSGFMSLIVSEMSKRFGVLFKHFKCCLVFLWLYQHIWIVLRSGKYLSSEFEWSVFKKNVIFVTNSSKREMYGQCDLRLSIGVSQDFHSITAVQFKNNLWFILIIIYRKTLLVLLDSFPNQRKMWCLSHSVHLDTVLNSNQNRIENSKANWF